MGKQVGLISFEYGPIGVTLNDLVDANLKATGISNIEVSLTAKVLPESKKKAKPGWIEIVWCTPGTTANYYTKIQVDFRIIEGYEFDGYTLTLKMAPEWAGTMVEFYDGIRFMPEDKTPRYGIPNRGDYRIEEMSDLVSEEDPETLIITFARTEAVVRREFAYLFAYLDAKAAAQASKAAEGGGATPGTSKKQPVPSEGGEGEEVGKKRTLDEAFQGAATQVP